MVEVVEIREKGIGIGLKKIVIFVFLNMIFGWEYLRVGWECGIVVVER